MHLGFTPTLCPPDQPPSSWFKSNIHQNTSCSGLPASLVFLFGCSSLWIWRNNRLFNPGKAINPIKDCLSHASEFFFLGPTHTQVTQKAITRVVWEPPPVGVFKLNTDDASKGNPGLAGAGGLIRNHRGEWIGGFARKIGNATNMCAELWALRDGLNLAIELNCTPLIVEMDALAAIQLISNNNNDHPCNTLLHDCRWCLSRLQVQEIKHVFGEGNHAADSLANLGCNLLSDFCVFDVPPCGVTNVLDFDVSRVGATRLCNLNSST